MAWWAPSYRKGGAVQPDACAVYGMALRGGVRICGSGTHSNERKGAARVDRDASRMVELRAVARAVAEASGAATERSGRPGGDVDAPNAVVVGVLQCIRGVLTKQLSQ